MIVHGSKRDPAEMLLLGVRSLVHRRLGAASPAMWERLLHGAPSPGLNFSQSLRAGLRLCHFFFVARVLTGAVLSAPLSPAQGNRILGSAIVIIVVVVTSFIPSLPSPTPQLTYTFPVSPQPTPACGSGGSLLTSKSPSTRATGLDCPPRGFVRIAVR